MQIKIAYPVSSEGERFSWTSKYKYLAESTLQMVLEEFSHAYQDISNNFLSESTGKYQSKKRDSNKSDMDEVDILAYLMDRGLDVKKLGVVDRYACRRDYYIWRSGQERLELIPLATPIGKSFSPTPSRLKENKQPTKRPKDPMPPELIVKPLKLSPK